MSYFKNAVLMVFFFMSGCTLLGIADSPEDFVKLNSSAKFGNTLEKITINRPMDNVIADITNFSNTCINGNGTETTKTTFTTYGQFESKSSEIFISGLTEPKDGVIFYIKVKGKIGVLLAAEFKQNGINTDLNLIRPSLGYNQISKQIKEWATGKTNVCPSLSVL